jgi:hypothetical protein
VQVLPRRNASDATTFNPVFKPPAPDPPRDLPEIIRAGALVPPMRASSPQQYEAPSDVQDAASSSVFSENNDEEEVTKTKLGVISGVVSLAVLLCALFGALLALLLRRPPGEHVWTASLLDGTTSRASIPKESWQWKKNPLAQATENGSVCPVKKSGIVCLHCLSRKCSFE